MCCAIRYDNPSIRARSPRRRRTVSAISWLCPGRRGGTLLSLPHIPTSSTSIVTFITTPPPLIAPGNPEIFGVPASPFASSLTGSSLKTDCPSWRTRNPGARVSTGIMENGRKNEKGRFPIRTGYFRCTKRTENKGCPGCGKIRKEEFEQFIFSAMQEKLKDFQILHGKEEKVNPKLTAYQVELAQVEAEIEKLLDTLTGANATLLAYVNKKIEELDTRLQTISKAIAELSVETMSPQQIKKLSYYLDNWDSIDFDDKRKAADGLISTIKATSDRVQIEWKI